MPSPARLQQQYLVDCLPPGWEGPADSSFTSICAQTPELFSASDGNHYFQTCALLCPCDMAELQNRVQDLTISQPIFTAGFSDTSA